MKKIPLLFKRKDRKVINEIDEDCLWIKDGYTATRKWNGSACAVRNGKFYKRYDAKKFFIPYKLTGWTLPAGFIPCMEPDYETRHYTGWIPVTKNDKWHLKGYEFYKNTFFCLIKEPQRAHLNIPDGTYELIGEKVLGNPEKITGHTLVPHGNFIHENCPYKYDELKEFFRELDIEGIVFYNIDSRMCKIRKKDFIYY